MVLCEYCVVTSYATPCMCSKDDSICPFTRRCNVAHRWLPLDSMNGCRKKYKEQKTEVLNLKEGEYKVEYIQHNKLYINIDGNLIRLVNPYDYEPKTVKLVRVDNELYIDEFAPKKKQKGKDTGSSKEKQE